MGEAQGWGMHKVGGRTRMGEAQGRGASLYQSKLVLAVRFPPILGVLFHVYIYICNVQKKSL